MMRLSFRERIRLRDAGSEGQEQHVCTLPPGNYKTVHDDQGFHVSKDGKQMLLLHDGRFEARERSDGTVEIFRVGERRSDFEPTEPVKTNDRRTAIGRLNDANRLFYDGKAAPRSVRTLRDINEANHRLHG